MVAATLSKDAVKEDKVSFRVQQMAGCSCYSNSVFREGPWG